VRNEWYSIFHAIRNLAEWNTLPYTGVIDRPDLQEILVRNMKEGTILNGMGINSYKQHEGERDDDCRRVQYVSIIEDDDDDWMNIDEGKVTCSTQRPSS